MPARSLLASAVFLAAAPALAALPTLKTVHEFTGLNGDGAIPEDAPVKGPAGLLYGTTVVGGSANSGMVFSLDAKTGTETPLYSFFGGTDGAQPQAGVVAQGHFLYGTTYEGGGGHEKICQGMGCGTVYKVNSATGQETVLHGFAGHGDGAIPSGGAMVLLSGALYGSTEYGGAANLGTVFRVDPSTGATTILYSFKGGQEGKRPQGGLLAVAGVLVGTTYEGGRKGCKYQCGTLFSVDPATGAETILHVFGAGGDGEYPFGDLSAHGSILYGVTLTGGTAGHGAVYQFDMTSGTETVLHSFVTSDDGAAPAGVTYFQGKLYGGTLVGGTAGYGVEFRLDPATQKETVFHQFTGGSDGGLAYGSPGIFGGALYGTTYQGGNLADCPGMGCGTIFQVTP
jgi:uncharacterized repeat protein (TIGR03803 family)